MTAPLALLHDVELKVTIDLEPVDAVVVTTLMDNVTDTFMPDQGPARRFYPAAANGCGRADDRAAGTRTR